MPARSWSSLTPAYRSRLIGSARSGKLTGRAITGTRAEVEAEAAQYYESGGELTRGRGHANPAYVTRPGTAAPKKATDLESVGMGDEKSWASLEKWRRRSSRNGGPPAWLRGTPAQLRAKNKRSPNDAIEVIWTDSDWNKQAGPSGDAIPESGLSTDVMAILSQLDVPVSKWKKVECRWTVGGEHDGTVVVVITPKRSRRTRTVILPDREAARQFGWFLKSTDPHG